MKNENTDIVEKKPTTLTEAIEIKQESEKWATSLLPSNCTIPLEKIIGSFNLELQKNPSLKKCDPLSLIESLKNSIADGLCFGTNRCYLIPYANKATYQRSYLGIIDLIRRSKAVRKIGAGVVYQNDTFEIIRGTEEKLVHIPVLEDSKRGQLIGAYMYAYSPEGDFITEYMTKKDIDIVMSKSRNSGAWKDFYPEMAKKAVIKRGAKYLPIDPDIIAALQKEDETEYGFEKPKKVVSSLNSALSPKSVEVESFESESLEPEEMEASNDEQEAA